MQPNLRLQGKTFHFRRRVPKAIVLLLHQNEVVHTLRTRCPRQAALRARALFIASEQAFNALSRAPEMDANQAQALVSEWLRISLQLLEEQKADGFEYYDTRKIDDGTYPANDLLHLLEAQSLYAKAHVRLYRDMLMENNFYWTEPIASKIAKAGGFHFDIDTSSSKFMARLVTRALIEMHDDIGRRLDGVFPPLQKDVQPHQNQNYQEFLPPPLPPSVLFSVGYKAHESDMCGPRAHPAKPWQEQTRRQNAKTAELWLELFGDNEVNSYTRDNAVAFKRALEHLPTNHGKSANDVRTLPEIVKTISEMPRDARPATIAMKTVKRHMSAMSGYFSWLLDRPELSKLKEVNILLNFKYGVSNSEEDRIMWEANDLKKLFATPIWTGCFSPQLRSRRGPLVIRDHQFWLPLIALFHGTRQEEVAQLRANDLGQEDGIWFLRLHAEDGNQLKNQQSVRRVPVHKFIIELGFLNYVMQVRNEGREHLWPGLTRSGPDGKYAYSYSKFFGRYCRTTGVFLKNRGFHSLRHTFRTFTEDTDTKSLWISRLMGHKLTALLGEGATYTKTKNRKVPLATLKEAVDAFDPGVDLSHLLPNPRPQESLPSLGQTDTMI